MASLKRVTSSRFSSTEFVSAPRSTGAAHWRAARAKLRDHVDRTRTRSRRDRPVRVRGGVASRRSRFPSLGLARLLALGLRRVEVTRDRTSASPRLIALVLRSILPARPTEAGEFLPLRDDLLRAGSDELRQPHRRLLQVFKCMTSADRARIRFPSSTSPK